MSPARSSHGRRPARKARLSARGRRRSSFVAPQRRRLDSADIPSDTSPAILLAYQGGAVRRALITMLLRLDCEVTPCDDGRAAIEQLATAHFDLVITGILMPNMDGLELMRKGVGAGEPSASVNGLDHEVVVR